MPFACKRADHVLDVIAAPDDDGPRDVVSERALPREPLAPGPSVDEESEQADGQCQHELHPDALPLEDHEGDGEDAEGEARRVHDALVFGGSRAGDGRVPGVEGRQHDQPGGS